MKDVIDDAVYEDELVEPAVIDSFIPGTETSADGFMGETSTANDYSQSSNTKRLFEDSEVSTSVIGMFETNDMMLDYDAGISTDSLGITSEMNNLGLNPGESSCLGVNGASGFNHAAVGEKLHLSYQEYDDLNQSFRDINVEEDETEGLNSGMAAAKSDISGGNVDISAQPSDLLHSARQCLFSELSAIDNNCEDDWVDEDVYLGNLLDDVVTETLLNESTRKQMNSTGDGIPQININDGVMGFTKAKPPPLTNGHPTPRLGRDDDIEVIDGGYTDIKSNLNIDDDSSDRLPTTPDNKISKSVLTLKKNKKAFSVFVPEFPGLHVRKSKINTIGSAYTPAGVKKLIKYMLGDETSNTDWATLVGLANITSATLIIWRLSRALHLSFIIKFLQYLPPTEAVVLRSDLGNCGTKISLLSDKWDESYQKFMDDQCAKSGTFQLHVDLMSHCDEVVGIYFAERIAGTQGYNLLLALVKQSLEFSFVNNASSYATFCVQLLVEHYSASPYVQRMKASLFSIPFKGSSTFFAQDAVREMEHQDAAKGFRPGADANAVLPRMALVDMFIELENQYKKTRTVKEKSLEDELHIGFGKKDHLFVLRATTLLLRRGGMDNKIAFEPMNVYCTENRVLPNTFLDVNSLPVGRFLATRFACTENLCQLTLSDLEVPNLPFCKDLLKRAVAGTANAIKRYTGKELKMSLATVEELQELKRHKEVDQVTQRAHCESSKMNSCQACVNPDCSKRKVQKARGMKTALRNVTSEITSTEPLEYSNVNSMKPEIRESVHLTVIEFAGVKFKLKQSIKTVNQYLCYVRDGVIVPKLVSFQRLKHMVICEEKYRYTPDDLKAATRQQRRGKEVGSDDSSINNLKVGSEIVGEEVIDSRAVTSTDEGKAGIGSCVAAHGSKLNIKKTICVDVCSDHRVRKCLCCALTEEQCTCGKDHKSYAIPVRYSFTETGDSSFTLLDGIRQRKGEAEMSQLDWLLHYQHTIPEKSSILSYVTSSDVDALPIHMFTLSHRWARSDDGFKVPVYVCLQKPGEVFNITALIHALESHYGEKYFAMKVAMALMIGGNDFIPKYLGITHEKVMASFLSSPEMVSKLFVLEFNNGGICTSAKIDKDMYATFMKNLYRPPSRVCPENTPLTYEETRYLSMYDPISKKQKDPRQFLPPMSCLSRIGNLINCQLEYLLTAGEHSAVTPKFLEYDCLERTESGKVVYNFGPEAKINIPEELRKLHELYLSKFTPQPRPKAPGPKAAKTSKASKKRATPSVPSTPRKSKKNRNVTTSTPRKAKKSLPTNE